MSTLFPIPVFGDAGVSGSPGWAAHINNLTGFYDARRSGVTANGSTDDTTALNAAAAAASSAGQSLLLPPGNIKITGTVTFADINVTGNGATIISPTANSPGTPAILATSSGGNEWSTVRGFALLGTGSATLGTKSGVGDGISIQGQVKGLFEDIQITGFDSGIVWDNTQGHLYHNRINVLNNYYGIYCTNNTNNYYITNSNINNNNYANLATPANQGFSGMRITNTHMGFAPFGIYQEATPTLTADIPFLYNVILDGCTFESIGNGAIWTDVPYPSGGHYSVVEGLSIRQPYFGWNGSFYYSGANSGYSVQLPRVTALVRVESGVAAFPTWHIQNLVDFIEVIDATTIAANFTVDLQGGNSGLMIGNTEFVAATGGAATWGQVLVSSDNYGVGNTGKPGNAQFVNPGVLAPALTGATAGARLVGGTTTGHPTTGTFLAGDVSIAHDAVMWVCTVGGTPGTWAAA